MLPWLNFKTFKNQTFVTIIHSGLDSLQKIMYGEKYHFYSLRI